MNMDRNKALPKVKGLPPIYCINLDDKTDRWDYMEDQFKYWELENYTRVSAYDGRGDNDLGEILKGRYPDNMTSGEVGCVTSHLNAMKMFLETDAPCALMWKMIVIFQRLLIGHLLGKSSTPKFHMIMMWYNSL